jgi:hypothetical protein
MSTATVEIEWSRRPDSCDREDQQTLATQEQNVDVSVEQRYAALRSLHEMRRDMLKQKRLGHADFDQGELDELIKYIEAMERPIVAIEARSAKPREEYLAQIARDLMSALK